jgi:hypothetical protein
MGEPQQIEELNNEFNMRMQALVKHAQKTANKNYTLDSGSGLDPDDVKKTIAEGGNVYSINPGMQNAITPIDEGNLNPVHFNLMQMIPQLIEEVSGVTDISKGIASKKQRQSATEATVLIESSYTRTRQRVRNLEWALKRMFRIVVQIMMQFYDEPKSVSGRTGSTTEWQMVGNSKDMAIDATKPAPMPREQTEQYEERAMQDQDVMHVMKAFDPVDPVYIDFDIELQTNSTLPTDQQARANQMLRLAEVQLTPNSIIDGEAVLDALRIPNKEEILQRKEKERQQAMMMQQQAAQQGVNQ